jgi:hypothetical protein
MSASAEQTSTQEEPGKCSIWGQKYGQMQQDHHDYPVTVAGAKEVVKTQREGERTL